MVANTIVRATMTCLLFSLQTVQGAHRRTISPCPPGWFPCNGTVKCIEQRFNCDGHSDCEDSSDEWYCEDNIKKEFWNNRFRKRPDEDREKKVVECELFSVPPECKCSEVSLFCDQRKLFVPPENLPENLLELDLSGNNISTIRESDFPKLDELNTLILTSSHVTSIEKDSFRSFPSLEKLYLTGNDISFLPNQTFSSNSKMQLLVLSHNRLLDLSQDAFVGLGNLNELDLRNCSIQNLPLGIFDPLSNLRLLWLDDNRITVIPEGIFSRLKELDTLSFSKNKLQAIDAGSLTGLTSLTSLSLSNNNIYRLDSNSFGNMTSLLKLDLSKNKIRHMEEDSLLGLPNLESLDLRVNSLRRTKAAVFSSLTSLEYIYFDYFHMCSYAQHVRVCEPRGDGISSIAHLLDSVVLRVSVWIVAVVACLGNLFVLIGRIIFTEPNEVHSFYIKNLSLADLLMGIYLLIIASYDVAFRGKYINHEDSWRHSWQCNFSGFLSTLSSEVSVFILTVITVDRYTSIIYPLTLKRRTIRSAAVFMVLTWTIAFVLSALPMLNISYYGDEFYGNNGVCLPLHIHDPYAQAWEYSTFLFCGVNMFAFTFILFAYISMFFSITNSKIGLRSTQQLQDRTIAKRFAFIVGTDFMCWMPIAFIKFISMAGVPIQADLYAWVAIFLLPVNSALNPVLYTLTTKLFKQHLAKIVYSCRIGAPGTHSNDNSISFSSILQYRGSKRMVVATHSENDHSCNNKTSLLPSNMAHPARPPVERKDTVLTAVSDML